MMIRSKVVGNRLEFASPKVCQFPFFSDALPRCGDRQGRRGKTKVKPHRHEAEKRRQESQRGMERRRWMSMDGGFTSHVLPHLSACRAQACNFSNSCSPRPKATPPQKNVGTRGRGNVLLYRFVVVRVGAKEGGDVEGWAS